MKSAFKKQMFVEAKTPKVGSSSGLGQTSNRQSFIDPATYMKNGQFVFKVPPEAPVFEPTVEEFLDPLAYINKIRPIAEKTGICKVKPPPDWHPPFAVDVDRFKFTPRVQKLNELDANTRVKLYFLDRLATYWNFSGVHIRYPAIDGKTVDLYSLYKIVELEGGFDLVNTEKKWSTVAARMGYPPEKLLGPQLRVHYKRLLLPYEKFEKMKTRGSNESDGDVKVEPSDKCELKKEPKSCNNKNTNAVKTEPGGVKRCTRSNCDNNDTEILVSDTFKNPLMQDKNKELQRLTFYGPGPKILGSTNKEKSNSKTNPDDTVSDSGCMICGKDDSEDCILLCDGCDDGYHTYCLVPPLSSVPKGEWRCPKCIAVVVSKATDTTFGFEQAEREYTLQQFGTMADQFKSNYFNTPVHLVPTTLVEQEYWKILSSMDSSISVEYGADLHSMDHGSGFPTKMAVSQSDCEDNYYKSYIDCNWNLNNIPVLEGSVLGHINADISGMKIPWMYVGMCFSTFCWHNEDHWSYSINYLHWGEPKTWYGVPGSKAEDFEQVMQETTPDLFRNQPDLLHQLVTILNPNILMDRGVPVYHIDQAAGEFVLTFPRAYHAGFNHGYNFAEAVNFAPLDWIPIGRECVEHYSSLHRYCVFSHDELICKMASVPNDLNSKLAAATYSDMIKMTEIESKLRKALLEWGVINAEREAFELLADDERQCAECNTTCFLSAVVCKCSPKKVTCLRHFQTHCSCPPANHTLRFRYTMDELPSMSEKLKDKEDSVAALKVKIADALDISTPRMITLCGLKELLEEAKSKMSTDDPVLNSLITAIRAVHIALAVDFKNIISPKKILDKLVTLTEIRSYRGELQKIPCILPQENDVKFFLKTVDEFESNVRDILHTETVTTKDVEKLLNSINFPNIEIPGVKTLTEYMKLLDFVELADCKEDKRTMTVAELDELLRIANSFRDMDVRVDGICRQITTERQNVASWESKVKRIIDGSAAQTSGKGSKYSLVALERIMTETNNMIINPPSKFTLESIINNTRAWREKVLDFIQKKSAHFLKSVEEFIVEGHNFPVALTELVPLKTYVTQANQWRKSVEKLFVDNASVASLIEVLMPRRKLRGICYYEKQNLVNVFDISSGKKMTYAAGDLKHKGDNSAADCATGMILDSLRTAEKREHELMRSLRLTNTFKRKDESSTYCICGGRDVENMAECTLCKDMFHESCLRRLSNFWRDMAKPCNLDMIFLCAFCQRSKRPSGKIVENALKQLDKLKIQTAEGIALKYLLSRESMWRASVEQLLNSAELKKLSSYPSTKNGGPSLGRDSQNRLDSLLFRGLLLELELPENEIVFKIIQKLCSNDEVSEVSNSLSRVEIDLTIESHSLQNEFFVPSRRDVRRHSSATTDATVKTVMLTRLEKPLPILGTSSSEPQRASTRKRRRQSLESVSFDLPRKRRSEPTRNVTQQELVVEDDDQMACDADPCFRPAEEHVDWVQCDLCKCWLHMMCVGVTKTEVESQTEFMCLLCRASNEEAEITARAELEAKSKAEAEEEEEEDDDDVIFIDYTKPATVCS